MSEISAKRPRVAVLYLVWSNEPFKYLPDAMSGMISQTYPRESWEVVVVYNSHKPDEPSAESFIREEFTKHERELPRYTFLFQNSNLGFTDGNNAGMRWAEQNGFDYVFLHNADGYLGPRCIEEMVAAMEADPRIGAAQALTLLSPETTLVNTSGNCFHYLAFGYSDDYRLDKNQITMAPVKDIGYASGCSVMVRTKLFPTAGLLPSEYYLYHEDTDYSLRLKLMGYRIVCIRSAEFFHKYSFGGRIARKVYWVERNRYAIMLVFYKWRTILAVLPMLILMEPALLLFSLRRGYARERFRVYGYWLNPRNWRIWLRRRREAQRLRVVYDREFFRGVVSDIRFQDVDNPILTYIGNPLMMVYWKVLSKIMVW